MTQLTMPFPPSANAIWRNVNGRTLKSKPYRVWLATSLALLRAQRAPSIKGSYSLAIVADRPDRRKRDLGNLEKAVSDCLVQAGVIEDDHLAQSILLGWSAAEPKAPGGITVSVVAV